MTSKYKEALDWFKYQDCCTDDDEDFDMQQTIRQALLIAERLESGEVSEGMITDDDYREIDREIRYLCGVP